MTKFLFVIKKSTLRLFNGVQGCMILIVGLGNIGKEYENTRHNVGFQFIDKLQKIWQGTSWHEEKKFSAFLSEVEKEGKKMLLVKPITYMNRSGIAVEKIQHFYKIVPENIFVIYDDLDLPLGSIRIRKEGSAGTHNGMKSILEYFKTTKIVRFRIGIEKREKKGESTSYVLSHWIKSEKKELEKAFENAVKAFEIALTKGIGKAMSLYNTAKSRRL